MMRIIAGEAKGRRIALKKAFSKRDAMPLRPTSAKVREAIFDIIKGRIENCSFLDLYAGSGSVGIEALSRGASHVVFVDDSPLRVDAIKAITRSIGFGGRVQVFRRSAVLFIQKLNREDKMSFDIVFADPPYGSQELDEIMPLLDKKDVISNNGLFIAEHPSKKTGMPSEVGNLQLTKQYKYGDTSLSFYTKKPSI